MAVGRGIASFVNGFVEGKNQKQAWADAKTQRERDEEDRLWAREDRVIAAEDRARLRAREDETDARNREIDAYNRRVRGINLSGLERTEALAQSDQEMYAAAVDETEKTHAKETEAAFETNVATAKGGAARAAAQPRDPFLLPGGALEEALTQPSKPVARGLGTIATQSPAPPQATSPAAAAAATAPVARGITSLIASPANAAPVDPNARPGIDPAPAAPPPASERHAALMAERAAASAPVHEARAARTAARAPAQAVGEAHTRGVTPPVAAQATDPARLDPGYPRPQEIAAAPAIPARGQNPVPPSQPTSAPAPAVTADSSPAMRARGLPSRPGEPAPEAAPRVMVPSDAPDAAAVITPSIEVADATFGPRRERGVSANTPAVRVARAREFMDIYRTEAVPKIERHLLQTGRIDEAKVWREWAKTEGFAAGTQGYGKTLLAIDLGDHEGALAEGIELFNNEDYFDDGYEAIASGSSIKYDRAGRAVGVSMEIRNRSTGETFKRDFDTDDFTALLTQYFAPENVLQRGMEEIRASRTAAQDFQVKQAEKELDHQRARELKEIEAGGEAAERAAKAVQDAREQLAAEDISFGSRPPNEQDALVAERVARNARIAGSTSLGSLGQGARGAAAPVDW